MRTCVLAGTALLALPEGRAQAPAARPAAPTTATTPAGDPRPTRSVTAAVTLAKAQGYAAQVDRLLAAGLEKLGVAENPIVDDATFLRRTFLAVVGRIPSLAEAEAFLADTAADKRARLVDRLLDSPGYTSNEANFWFDLLRVKSRQRQVSGEPFAHWIRESIRDGVPYDAFVQQMLTAEGPAQKAGSGATGFLLRDANMPHDAMANTMRLFLGTRIECAQCHNHPFDKWTQREFYGLAAFFGGLRYRVELDRDVRVEVTRMLADADDRTKQAARRALLNLGTGIAGSGTGVERLPQDYKYDDARPRDAVFAHTIFGADVDLPRRGAPAEPRGRGRRPGALAQRLGVGAEVDSRRAFAQWLASPQNDRFARVIAGRIWQRLFGRGLIEPVDELKDDTVAVHPRLQAYLEKLLVELKFDLRQFERVLLQTRLFQRECCAEDPSPDAPYAFPGPLLRRQSAEQLWDSLLTLMVDDVDANLLPIDARARDAYQRYAATASGSAEEIVANLQQQMLRQTDPQKFREMQAERLRQEQTARREQDVQRQQQLRALQRQLAAARRRGDQQAIAQLEAEIGKLGVQRPGARGGRGRDGELQRASDMVQPANPGHPLRQFGQSDRETMDAATRSATVPQGLTLMNGFLDSRVLAPGSSLRRALDGIADPAATVRAAFVALLSRPPSESEQQTWVAEMATDRATALADLVWVLCNTNEFRFCR